MGCSRLRAGQDGRIECQPVVSIQQDVEGDAVARHLCWGVLVDDDVVVVPGPLGWLRDTSVVLEVLLASARRSGPGVVERIRLRHAEISGLRSVADDAAAILRLASPSRHRPFPSRCDRDELAARLTENPNVWTALEDVGAVPKGVPDLPVSAVLGPVARWERQRREQLVRDGLVAKPVDVASSWCCAAFPICCRHIQCVGPWWQ